MKSFIYWHPLIYSFFIRLSYGKNYSKRYEAVRDLIEDGSSVVDICCGDCRIYDYLKNKNIRYTGLDFNPCFVEMASKRGIKAGIFDLRVDEIPKADYILLQGSLYQFIPKEKEILQKLLDAAAKYLIISEPIKNKADSKSRIISFLSRKLNDPGDGVKNYRFNIDTFRAALAPFRGNVVKEFFAANGIDYIIVIKKDVGYNESEENNK